MNATLKVDRQAIGRLGLAKAAEKIVSRLNDVRPAWDAVRSLIFLQEEEVFAAEGAVEGFARWDPLGPTEYAMWKGSHFPGQPILQLSGRMKNQLTGRTGDHYERRTPSSICIGSNYPAMQGSGRRSSWATEGIGTRVLPRGSRWSLDPEGADIAGLHASGGFSFLDVYRVVDVYARSPIRITQGYTDMMGDVIVEYVVTGEAPRIR